MRIPGFLSRSCSESGYLAGAGAVPKQAGSETLADPHELLYGSEENNNNNNFSTKIQFLIKMDLCYTSTGTVKEANFGHISQKNEN